ncbi:MAG TPA: PAC2 family protein [Candidatus Nanoarchaeia archaeon]|nr:PAC2 family protein [Candidatus Nanoarchaeia archaeon]
MTFDIKNIEKIKMKSPIVIEGLPGIGNVGKIAIDFIIESIKAKKITTIHSSSFPHSVFVNEQNLIDLPAISLYHKKIKQQDYLFIAGDVQPLDERSCHEFCSLILGELSKYNVKEIITLGGIGLPKIPKQPRVYITGNAQEIVKKYHSKEIDKNIFGTVGPIIGVSGLLAGLAGKNNIPAIILLAQTFGHPAYMGIKPARELIKILDKKFSFNINMQSLDKEISELESAIKVKLPQQQNIIQRQDKASYIG